MSITMFLSHIDMSFQAILFDFDGVLCKDRFYETSLLPKYSAVYDWIQKNIFGNKELVRTWMRNQVGSSEINNIIAKNTGMQYDVLNELFKESIYTMVLDDTMLDLAGQLKLSGKKLGVVTDNMDIFTEITVPHHRLNDVFDVVINSADYGMLKNENNGQLFDVALAALGQKIEDSLVIDNSASPVDLFIKKGGHGFLYKDFAELKTFLQVNA